jgi:hypothetical protein
MHIVWFPQNTEAVKESFIKIPRRSAREHSVVLGISNHSVRRILHKDLNLKITTHNYMKNWVLKTAKSRFSSISVLPIQSTPHFSATSKLHFTQLTVLVSCRVLRRIFGPKRDDSCPYLQSSILFTATGDLKHPCSWRGNWAGQYCDRTPESQSGPLLDGASLSNEPLPRIWCTRYSLNYWKPIPWQWLLRNSYHRITRVSDTTQTWITVLNTWRLWVLFGSSKVTKEDQNTEGMWISQPQESIN